MSTNHRADNLRVDRTTLESRVARFANLNATGGGTPDSELPHCAQEMLNVIGFQAPKGVSLDDEAVVSPVGRDSSASAAIDIAEGFNLAFIKARPGNGTILHNHDTNETFIPISGTWRFRCNDDDDVYVDLQALDTISLPAGLQRRFTNVESDSGEDETSLMICIVAGDRPRSFIDPTVLQRAKTDGAFTPAAFA